MAYNTKTKLYYYPYSGSPSEDNRFVPMPLISIEPELLYVNDIAIGYNYIITLNGYATSLDLRTYTGGEVNFTNTLESVQKIRDIFNQNGNTLKVTTTNEGDVIVASGGLLQSLDFQENENNWYNYAQYTAQLSFNSLHFTQCAPFSMEFIGCNTSLPSGVNDINADYLVDMKKYKIKSITENWDIDATNIHNNSYDIPNAYLDITYNVQAVGKHFMSAKSDGSFGFTPAWQQAKTYCLDRLRKEIKKLNEFKIGPLLSTDQNSTCSITTKWEDLSQDETTSILSQLPVGEYKIYNETLQTEVSESDGSFSLVYTSILKQVKSNESLFDNKHCIHRISRNRSTSDDGNKKTVTETVQGEIEGLLLGGLRENSEMLSIPDSGTGGHLIDCDTSPPSVETKYKNALEAYQAIINSGTSIGRELKQEVVVDILGITNETLDPLCANPSAKPKKNSHNVIHNFAAGTISYTEEYTNENINANSGVSISNVSVSIQDSVPQTAEFVVPGRQNGPIIQRFTAYTPKTVTIAIDGTSPLECCDKLDILTTDICSQGLALPNGVPGTGLASYEIKNNTFNFNINDGSFTINREYIFIG